MRFYLSEEEVAEGPSDESFLDVGVSIDGVISFSCEIFVDVLDGVIEKVIELSG